MHVYIGPKKEESAISPLIQTEVYVRKKPIFTN